MIGNSHVVFELKKLENAQKNNIIQAQLQLLALDRHSQYNVISVLTDLNDFWKISWIEKEPANLKGIIAQIYSYETDRSLAVGFLRYHLKIVLKMLKMHDRIVDPKHDEDEESRDDERMAAKKQRMILKSRPTFKGDTVKISRTFSSVDDPQMDMTSDEIAEKLIRNFAYTHQRYLNRDINLLELPTEEDSVLDRWMLQDV
jgi:hypothetical protein